MNIKLLRIIVVNILCLSFCTTVFGESYDEKYDYIINIIAPYISDENKDEEISRRDCVETIMKLIGLDTETAELVGRSIHCHNPFYDIPDRNKVNGYIISAAYARIAEGEDIFVKEVSSREKVFYPDRSVTVKECLAFMVRCMKSWRSVEWGNVLSDSIELGLLAECELEELSDDSFLTEQDFYILLYRMLDQNRYVYFESGQDYSKYDETNSIRYIDWWYENNDTQEDVVVQE